MKVLAASLAQWLVSLCECPTSALAVRNFSLLLLTSGPVGAAEYSSSMKTWPIFYRVTIEAFLKCKIIIIAISIIFSHSPKFVSVLRTTI